MRLPADAAKAEWGPQHPASGGGRIAVRLRLGLAFSVFTAFTVGGGLFSIGQMGRIGDALRDVGHERAEPLEPVC